MFDEIGKRMKEYEEVSKYKLTKRMPVIIRIDGKAFHTFTKGFNKPFDDILINTMQDTMKYLCNNIQGCVLGYTQSDEITLLLIDYKNLNTNPWFNNEVQKICSISASMATMAFNKFFEERAVQFIKDNYTNVLIEVDLFKYFKKLSEAAKKGAMFDARCFNIPKEEVTNNFYWRQLDATRNSILSVGQFYFSHKDLHGKSCNEIQDMLFEKFNINWNDYPTHKKRGSCCIKQKIKSVEPNTNNECTKNVWIIDENIPIFKNEGREYIEKLVNIGDERSEQLT